MPRESFWSTQCIEKTQWLCDTFLID
jgi:hypothetical protein